MHAYFRCTIESWKLEIRLEYSSLPHFLLITSTIGIHWFLILLFLFLLFTISYSFPPHKFIFYLSLSLKLFIHPHIHYKLCCFNLNWTFIFLLNWVWVWWNSLHSLIWMFLGFLQLWAFVSFFFHLAHLEERKRSDHEIHWLVF